VPALSGSHANLNAAAQQRAVEIEAKFSHDRPDGSAWLTVFSEFDVSYTRAGENIAWGHGTPASVVIGWMGSLGHRANILDPDFNRLGVGVHVDAAGRLCWVQLFIRDSAFVRGPCPVDPDASTCDCTTSTIFNTGWRSTFWNWLLFILGFGWIWMWF
jgi:hypothetical protein